MSELVLNWGIIATGRISEDFCTALLSLNSPYHKIQACAARNTTNASNFASKFAIPLFYDSYDSLISDPNVTIVYIGTVSSLHKPLTLKALNAGKHVLCEKPMCLNEAEMNEVLAASKNNNRFLMEALWTRHFPLIERLRQELRSGSIGKVKVLNSNFTVPIELKDKDLGGGSLYDIGIYPIQLACLVFENERPLEIVATGGLTESGVDEWCSVCLRYEGGRMAVLNVSTSAAFFAPVHIIGETGVIQIPNNSFAPTELILPNGYVVRDELPQCGATNFPNSVGLRFQAEAAREAISQGLIEHSKMTHSDSRLVCQIMDEARRQLGYTD